MKTLALKTSLLAGAVAAAVLAVGSPAMAHDVTKNLTSGGLTCCTLAQVKVTNSHSKITIEDMLANNRGVWVEFNYRVPGHVDDFYRTLSDPDGKGGSNGEWSQSGVTITSFRIHENVSGKVSPWYGA